MFRCFQTSEKEEIRKDDTMIQIDSASSVSHEPTQGEGSQAAVEEVNRSLIPQLKDSAARGDWNKAMPFYQDFPEMLSDTLDLSGDTALHVAVNAFQIEYANNLIDRMTPEALEIPNTRGNTAFMMAVITGNENLLQKMLQKNQNLALIPGQDGMLPVHLIASSSLRQILRDLCKENLLNTMDFEDVKRLFFILINNRKYYRAMELLVKYRDGLTFERDDRGQTALHLVAQMHSKEFASMTDQLFSSKDMSNVDNSEAKSEPRKERELFVTLWDRVKLIEYYEMVELISKPSVVLFDLVKSEYVEVLKYVLNSTPQLLSLKDPDNGRSLLHYAALYRQSSLFRFILEMKTVNLIIRAEDNDRNNVLHCAALQPETSSSLTSDIQLQKELAWFKEVENKVPPELRIRRNKDGKTPDNLFYIKRKEYSTEVTEATQHIINAGMVVAALIVSVAFSAALAIPRDKFDAKFIIFHLFNAISLFTSSASLISFMTIFTSRFIKKEFIVSLHSSLILGLAALVISITAMATAFAAASFVIFDHKSKWVAIVIASMVLIPMVISLVVYFKFFDTLLYKYWSRRYRLSKVE